MEVNLTGDAKATLAALLPLLEQNENGEWREDIAAWLEAWWETLDDRAHAKASPVNPQRVFTELSPRLPDDVILTSDSGSAANWYARDLKFRRGMVGSLSGGLASMGAGVPYAIAAKFAFPDRPVIALVGDGAMQMNGMAELITVHKYWEQWADPRFIVMVLNNEDLNQVTWEQRVMEGNPRYLATQQIPNVPYHRFAEMIGLEGIFVDDPERLGSAWDQALAARRPVVLEVKSDPEVPPLPPHISFDQARKFVSMLVKGDPNEAAVIKGSIRQVLASVLPGDD
jgi:pyruvate dehydrogenase (quinone)